MMRTSRGTTLGAVAVLAALFSAALVAVPRPASAASATVQIRDNSFVPNEVHIEPGDSVVWHYNQGRSVHDVTSDERGEFGSGDIRPGGTYEHRFPEEGFYPYFCRYHGGRGGAGMSGLVVVGDPSPREEPGTDRPAKPRIVVPSDFPTIQKAVDAAAPGTEIVIRPGVYREAVVVKTPRLVIRGVDRFRTILHGGDEKGNGFVVDGVNDVTVKNLTVRNYLENGIFFNDMVDYRATKIDAIKNRTYGIYAFNSYDGVIENSFGYGSADSAFYIGQCMGCGGLVENVNARKNYIGYSGTNATGVVVRDSIFTNNGVGVVPNTLPTEELGPNRGTLIVHNLIKNNNYSKIPARGFSETVGLPFGTGVWTPGVQNNVVKANRILNHQRYGVLISQSAAGEPFPINNRVRRNFIRNSGRYDLAWDGTGYDNCFLNNDFTGETGPPDIETLYSCHNRPFAGVPFAPVQADVAASLSNSQTREEEEPPEPKRPRCQKGAPGCDR